MKLIMYVYMGADQPAPIAEIDWTNRPIPPHHGRATLNGVLCFLNVDVDWTFDTREDWSVIPPTQGNGEITVHVTFLPKDGTISRGPAGEWIRWWERPESA